MDEKALALRLADALTVQVEIGGGDLTELEQAAAELRRLHALNGELLGACRTAMMLKHLGGMLPGSREIVDLVVDAARAALARAEGGQT
jgi:hypothetical protein